MNTKFSDLTQDDLDRMDAARSERGYKAAWTRKLEADRAKRDAQRDLDLQLVLGERADRDTWAAGVTATYRKTYRDERIRLTTQMGDLFGEKERVMA
jgi:hypothetical protein